jgi:hypothetical protein
LSTVWWISAKTEKIGNNESLSPKTKAKRKRVMGRSPCPRAKRISMANTMLLKSSSTGTTMVVTFAMGFTLQRIAPGTRS